MPAAPTRPDLNLAGAQHRSKGPQRFAGRKLGILVTDGVDARCWLKALRPRLIEGGRDVRDHGAQGDGGASDSDGSWSTRDQMIDGGPSVLYDAVVICGSSAPRWTSCLQASAARDFVTDAFAHCKFIGHTAPSVALLAATGLSELIDDGFVELGANGSAAKDFLSRCSQLRFWARQLR